MQVLRAAWARLLARAVATGLRPVPERAVKRQEIPSQEQERGQTLAEYSLLIGLVAITAIVALAALGSATDGMFWEPINRVFGEVVAMVTS